MRGTTIDLTGSTPITRSASSSSRIFRAPNSAVYVVPITPAKTAPVIVTPNSRIRPTPRNAALRSLAPSCSSGTPSARPMMLNAKIAFTASTGRITVRRMNTDWIAASRNQIGRRVSSDRSASMPSTTAAPRFENDVWKMSTPGRGCRGSAGLPPSLPSIAPLLPRALMVPRQRRGVVWREPSPAVADVTSPHRRPLRFAGAGSSAMSDERAAAQGAVVARPALAGRGLLLETVEGAHLAAEVVHGVDQRGLTGAGRDRAAVLEAAVVREDHVQQRAGDRGREAVGRLDLAADAEVAERDLALELAGVREVGTAVRRCVGLELADVVKQRAGDGDVTVDAREQ